MIPFIKLGTIQIPSFFLIISLGLSALVFYLSYRIKILKKKPSLAYDIALLLMVSGFAGGRLLHILYEALPTYKADPIKLFFFWDGGFVFYGGFLLCLIFGFLFSYYKKISFFEWADFFTPLFSLAHAIGRFGCFLAGCCYGEFCNLSWAINNRHPTALYLSIGELCIFGFLFFAEKKSIYPQKGLLFLKWILLHSLLRFNVEYFRADFRGDLIDAGVLGVLSISQVISIILALGSLCLYIWIMYKSRNKNVA